MPLTPFHLAPALALKAVRPRWTGLLPFALAQIVMDIEPAVRLVLGGPLHGPLHSVGGGILAGLASAAAASRMMKASWKGALMGGLFGGISHVVLDAVVHPDVMLFWPLAGGNPLYVAESFVPVHWLLAVLILILLVRL